MKTSYTLVDGDGQQETIAAQTDDPAHLRHRARRWVRGGDWNTDAGPLTVAVEIHRDGAVIDRLEVEVE